MQKIYRVFLLILLPALLLQQCSSLTDPEPPKWDMELYGPLSLVNVELSDLFSGAVFTYGTSFTPTDLKLNTYFPANKPFPPIGPLNLPTIDTVITKDFLSVTLNSAKLGITITNTWPINIKTGSVVILENDEGNEIVRFTLERNINANGGTYETQVPVQNVKYTAHMRIKFESFSTDGSGTTPITLADQPLEFLFAPSEMDIQEMTITDNREIYYENANDFSLAGERLKTLGVVGKFYTKFSNPHPFSFTNQTYLMLKDSTIVDSLFNGQQLILGSEGQTLSSSCPNLRGNILNSGGIAEKPVVSRDTIDLNTTRLNNMNSAQIAKIKGYICLPQNPDGSGRWTMRKEDILSLKIIGDVTMRVDFSKKD